MKKVEDKLKFISFYKRINKRKGGIAVEKGKKNIFNFAVLFISAAVMLYFMFSIDGPKALIATIISAKPIFLICALGCMVIYWLLEAGAFKSLCRGLKSKIGFKDCFHTSMIGQLFNCITPFATGGQPMQAYTLTKCGMGLGQASCALLAKFIVYQTVLTLYTTAVIAFKLNFFVANVSGFALIILIGFAVNFLVMLLIFSIGFFPKITAKALNGLLRLAAKLKIVKKLDEKQEKLNSEIEKFYNDFSILKKNPAQFIVPALLTVLQLTAFFSVPYFVCLSLSATHISYSLIVCAAAFVLMISSFVPLPGGSGGAEGGFYMFFGMFFVQSGILAAAVLLWRIVTFYFPIIAGMICNHIPIGKKAAKLPAKV